LPTAASLVVALLVSVRAFPKGVVIVDNNSNNMATSVKATILPVALVVLVAVAIEVLFFLFLLLLFSNTKVATQTTDLSEL
jgi:hypothetical protein